MKASYLVVLLVALLLIGCAPEAPAADEETAPAEPSAPAEGEAAAAEEAAAPSEASIDITASGFDPVEVTINAGGSVTWTNVDTSTHMVAGPKRLFSEKLAAGDTYTQVFEEAGEQEIMNIVPAKFFGTVIVE